MGNNPTQETVCVLHMKVNGKTTRGWVTAFCDMSMVLSCAFSSSVLFLSPPHFFRDDEMATLGKCVVIIYPNGDRYVGDCVPATNVCYTLTS